MRLQKKILKIHNYDENEILKNEKILFNEILSKSFFEKEKLIIVSRASDKIYKIITEIVYISRCAKQKRYEYEFINTPYKEMLLKEER